MIFLFWFLSENIQTTNFPLAHHPPTFAHTDTAINRGYKQITIILNASHLCLSAYTSICMLFHIIHQWQPFFCKSYGSQWNLFCFLSSPTLPCSPAWSHLLSVCTSPCLNWVSCFSVLLYTVILSVALNRRIIFKIDKVASKHPSKNYKNYTSKCMAFSEEVKW